MVTNSPQETQAAGYQLSSNLAPGDIIALNGSIGAGKTTFIQGLACGLGIKERITSPTFIIMKVYSGQVPFVHVDLYRLEDDVEAQIDNLGLSDIIKAGESIVVIEWAERIKDILPKKTKWIEFTYVGEDKREIIIL